MVMVRVWDCKLLSVLVKSGHPPKDTTYSSGSVGNAIEGQGSGQGADGRENADGRGDVGLVGPGRDRCGEASNNGKLSELHFE